MSRRVAAYVHVAGRVFAPGDEVPDGFAKRITNPAAWGDEPLDEGGDLPPGTVPAQNGTGQREDVVAEPPRSGKGSGRDAWAAYAAEHGAEAPEGATREEIIAELEERGVIARAE